MPGKRVLLTGATGLLGEYIAETLLSAGYQVTALCRPGSEARLPAYLRSKLSIATGDISELNTLDAAISRADYVVHAAALVSFIPADRKALYAVNLEGTANVVNVCLKYAEPEGALKKLVHISSIAALGRTKGKNIINEESKWEASADNSIYAKTKYLAELEVWRGFHEGLDIGILNPGMILGPGDINGGSSALFGYAWKERSFVTEGIANYCDVRDVARAVLLQLQNPESGKRYVVNAGHTPYKSLFGEMARRFGKKPPLRVVGSTLAAIAWRMEFIRSVLTGMKPFITRETAQSSLNTFIYEGTLIEKELGLKYHTLAETLDWACAEIMSKMKS